MKLAALSLSTKDFDKARMELDQILARIPEYPDACFMHAVISAKEKNFTAAWRHIGAAQKGAPDNRQIKDFIDRLEKACPKASISAK